MAAGVEVDERARALLAEIIRAAEAGDLDCGALSFRRAEVAVADGEAGKGG